MGYYQHRFKLSAVLDDLSTTGLPVDRERQSALRDYIATEETRLLAELQRLIPRELLPFKEYKGWPKDLRESVKAAGLYVKRCLPVQFPEFVAAGGYEFVEEVLTKLLPFNPDSHQQILNYLRYMNYEIPLHIDTKKPTTGQKEIESLILDTDDAVLKTIAKAKKLTKLGGVYCSGDWMPGSDGRVHGTFRFGTTVGQTSCVRPNQQQFPGHSDPDDLWLTPIMEAIKGCIRAQPGHVFVKLDAKGAHSRMQAFLAEDASYYRLSNLGTHAFNTAHYVGVEDRDTLLAMADGPLLKRLKEIKKQYDWEYNFAKRVSFNMQYLGGAEKAAHTLRVPVLQVVALMELIKGLFPKSFKEFPEKVRRQMKQHPRLMSQQGACRWLWEPDIQQGVAFAVANEFHCHWQSGLIRLHERGLMQKYEACNFCHDDIWFHVREKLADECIERCREELEQPSSVLVNSLGHFQVNTEVQRGYDMQHLEDV